MARISVTLGVTLRVSNNNEYVKMGVEIHDVDTSLPLEPQLDESVGALRRTFDVAESILQEKIKAETGRGI